MKVAVLGCGAIGGLFLGYLSQKEVDVVGVVRDSQREALLYEGLTIEGVRGLTQCSVKVVLKLTEPVDVAIVATKINDVEAIIEDNQEFLSGAVVVSTQNGIAADYLLEKYFARERILTGIVMFGGTFYPPACVVHNFEGALIVGNVFDAVVDGQESIVTLLEKAFSVTREPEIKGAKFLKIFVNVNNALPAILGVSMQEAFGDVDIARLAIYLNKEAYQVVTGSGIVLVDLPNYPKSRIEGLVSMPSEQAAAIFSNVMTGLSGKPLFGSILQSIQRGKPSEIDYINGEIVALAKANGFQAPLNETAVTLVHQVEDTGTFLTKDELMASLNSFLQEGNHV